MNPIRPHNNRKKPGPLLVMADLLLCLSLLPFLLQSTTASSYTNSSSTVNTPSQDECIGDNPPGLPLRTMSFNIRYDNRRDGMNSWPLRVHMVAATIRLYRPDILGLQEAYWRQVSGITERVPGYASFGKGRDNGVGERCTILYRDDLYELLRHDTFWLSETPDKSSKSWGSSMNRIVTWGEFREPNSGQHFFVFNTHFDHRSKAARKESAKLLLRQIRKLAGSVPCILMGDFNCTEDSTPYDILTQGLRNSRELSRTGHIGSSGSCQGFDGVARPGYLIDFIFVSKNIDVIRHASIADAWDGRTPSDHRPILADLVIGSEPEQPQVEMHENWRFKTDPSRTGIQNGFHESGVNDSSWKIIHVGRSWEQQGFEDYDGQAFYRKQIHIPQAWQSQDRIAFIITGVDDAFTLYINGTQAARAGSAEDSLWNRRAVVNLPRSLFRFGQNNQIVIAVDDFGGAGGILGWPCKLTTMPHQSTHQSLLFETSTPLPETKFYINSPETRTLDYIIDAHDATDKSAWLRIAIGNSSDDSGDCGLFYRIEDAVGTVVTSEFLRADQKVWREIKLTSAPPYHLILEDLDTRLNGKHPGNGGTVEAQVFIESPP